MTYDINIMGPPSDTVTALRLDNTAITGLQKLVQKTLVLLFTDSTAPESLGTGTTLVASLKGVHADTEMIRNIFNIALSKVLMTIKSQTPLSAPDEEKLQGYNAVVTAGDRGEALVSITVSSVAGTTAIVRVPTKTVV